MLNDHLVAIKIQQTANSKPVYLSNIKFSLLKKLCKLTTRYSDKRYFQRDTDKNHIKGLVQFIIDKLKQENNLNTIPFPTPIIIALDPFIETQFNEEPLTENIANNSILVGQLDPNIPSIFKFSFDLNFLQESFIIVDGQHRFKALEIANSMNTQIDFELNIMILIEYDNFQQAKVFTDVNFNQKPMNKSLVYDIYGTLPTMGKEYSFIHHIINNINETETHQLYNMIKMLGTGYGIISQAFFSEILLEILDLNNHEENLKYFRKQFILFKELNNEPSNTINNDQKKVINEISDNLNTYFKFIKRKFEALWPKTFDKYLLLELNNLPMNDTKRERLQKKYEEVQNKPIYSSYYYKESLLKTNGFYVLLKIANTLFSQLNFDSSKYDAIFQKINNEYFTSTGTGKAQQQSMLKKINDDLVL